MLLVKLKSLHTSACLNLNYDTTKQKRKKWRVQTDILERDKLLMKPLKYERVHP